MNAKDKILVSLSGVAVTLLLFGVNFLSDISKSVQELNIKVAVVIAKVEANTKEIDTLKKTKQP